MFRFAWIAVLLTLGFVVLLGPASAVHSERSRVAQDREFSALKDLRCLRLDRTRITDAGLAHLVELTGLEELDLGHTPVTDDGLKVLARIPSLTTLGFDGTAISDAGLVHLEPLGQLKIVYIAETKVTRDGVAAFRSASPGRQVILQGLENLSRQLEVAGARLADWD